MKCCRYRILSIAVFGIIVAGALAQSKSLKVEYCGDHLQVVTTQKHFLNGKALEMLHNGATVTFVLSLGVIEDKPTIHAPILQEQFLISFDLWEEKYSVVKGGPGGQAASRLTADMTEEWCLKNMPIPLGSVPEQKPFMISLECSIEDGEGEIGEKSNSTLTLARLIDIFSRKRSAGPPRWEAVSDFLRLDDLKRRDQSR